MIAAMPWITPKMPIMSIITAAKPMPPTAQPLGSGLRDESYWLIVRPSSHIDQS